MLRAPGLLLLRPAILIEPPGFSIKKVQQGLQSKNKTPMSTFRPWDSPSEGMLHFLIPLQNFTIEIRPKSLNNRCLIYHRRRSSFWATELPFCRRTQIYLLEKSRARLELLSYWRSKTCNGRYSYKLSPIPRWACIKSLSFHLTSQQECLVTGLHLSMKQYRNYSLLKTPFMKVKSPRVKGTDTVKLFILMVTFSRDSLKQENATGQVCVSLQPLDPFTKGSGEKINRWVTE
jgi:hypothetical protein